MARLFGTDGIRGVANVDLKPTLAYALGRATAHRLAGAGGAIVVGQDTRRSGDMFVAAITAGATSLGVDVHVVGVVPTPALAFLAGSGPFAAGIMVSASHNPADDNGLKVLDADGLKLDDAIEEELEQLIWREGELAASGNAGIGRPDRCRAPAWPPTASTGWRSPLPSTARGLQRRPRRRRTARAGRSADRDPARRPGAQVEAIHVEPDGVNINVRAARRTRRPWPRRSSRAAPTSGSRSTATPTG